MLVDRLGRTDAVEFGRTIGGEHEQRHERLRGLGNARVEFRCRRSTGHHNRHRLAGGECATKGEEPGASLVNANVYAQFTT